MARARRGLLAPCALLACLVPSGGPGAWVGGAPRRPLPCCHRSARRAAGAAEPQLGPLEVVQSWGNETWQFLEALEIWTGTPIDQDDAKEARSLVRGIDRINRTAIQLTSLKDADGLVPQSVSDNFNDALWRLPGLMAAYYYMRITRTLSKKIVVRGMSNSVVFLNIGLAAVFFRVIAPRLVAAGSLDELFEAGQFFGIPDRASLRSVVEYVQDYDFFLKAGAYLLAFCLEKVTMVSEFLPIQIGLKTLAPVLFGGLVPGAIGSAVCETLGALLNFTIGRQLLSSQIKSLSAFGGPPLREAKWFAAVSRAAKEDGFRLSLLLRLSPVLPIPFDSYWYLLGALPVSALDFTAAHFLGCLKTAFLDASFGVLLLTSVSLDSDEVRAQAQQVLLLESLAFAIVALLIGSIATRLTNELLELEEKEEEGEASPASTEAAGEARRVD